MDELVDDILSLMSDIVMIADTENQVDVENLEKLHAMIEIYFREKDDEIETFDS